MCGINGLISWKQPSADNRMLVERMNHALQHRGPDGEGIWSTLDHRVHLGHRRLSILDLSEAGKQPMIDRETQTVISYNGEVFNFQELKSHWLSDQSFQSRTDTEVLLKLYRKLGKEMFPQLNGMFAIAIWDQQAEELVLARDLIGKKPLYWHFDGQTFSFSSEIRSLLELPWISAKLDEEAAYDFLTYNMTLGSQTMYQGIHKLEPGKLLVFNKRSEVQIHSFQELQLESAFPEDESELIRELQQRTRSVVEKRMISDVPVGLFLSGGVDSGAILGISHELGHRNMACYNVSYEGAENYNERVYAEQLAKRFDAQLENCVVQKEDVLTYLPQIIETYDEPQADTTAIPIHFISKMASEQGYKVMLNGDGPDELFAGYNSYQNYLQKDAWFQKMKDMPSVIQRFAHTGLKYFKAESNELEMMERILQKQHFYWPGAAGIKASHKKHLMSTDFMKRNPHLDSYNAVRALEKDFFAFKKSDQFDLLDWMCFTGIKQAIPERFLYRSDKIGMSHSLEMRSPFLDREFVQWSLSLPGKWKIKDGTGKYLFKKSLEDLLPPEILYRKKMGFCVPLKEWISETILSEIDQELDYFCQNSDLFDRKRVQTYIHQLRNGNESMTNRIWTIYFFIKWHRRWMT
ncbi:MAG: asparagine synthase (glutamine-hydrolyzing) [Bacteroidetes bacterium]|nr:MAG: asparagine synthase (glutamine-hydrolyzing) [Bacteroidota bacterium]